jgi:hypothetical protein
MHLVTSPQNRAIFLKFQTFAWICAALSSLSLVRGEALNVTASVKESQIGMGRTVAVEAKVQSVEGSPVEGYQMLPYVNGRRWGSHETSNADGIARFLIPLPDPGTASIQVLARKFNPDSAASWIWIDPYDEALRTAWFSKTFDLPKGFGDGELWVAVDDSAVVFLNGREVQTKMGWADNKAVRVPASLLREKENVLAVEAVNAGAGAGLLVLLTVPGPKGESVIASGSDWTFHLEKPSGWPEKPVDGTPAAAYSNAYGSALMPEPWPGLEGYRDIYTGTPLREGAGVISQPVQVEVTARTLTQFPKNPDQRIMVQWEPWFTPLNAWWQTSQAVPLLGFYTSLDPAVIRQQIIWLTESGSDIISADWSNHIWTQNTWSEIGPGSWEIIRATTLLFDELVKMRDAGQEVPQVSILTGISRKPTGIDAVNGQLAYIYDTYVSNPKYKGLWAELDGKPLVQILDLDADYLLRAREGKIQLDDRFTIRHTSAHLDINGRGKLGMWTWVDSEYPTVTIGPDGKAEAMTANIGCFGIGGWFGDMTRSRRNGSTLLEDWKRVMEARPKVVQMHQFNEFLGAREGHFSSAEKVYVDSYSAELSDDYEPTSLTASAYRGENGYGFYYLNLVRAVTDLYRSEKPETTVLAFKAPVSPKPGHSLIPDVSGEFLELEWMAIGREASSYQIEVNGEVVARDITGKKYRLELSKLPAGILTIRLVGNDTKTNFELLFDKESTRLKEPVPASCLVRVKHRK